MSDATADDIDYTYQPDDERERNMDVLNRHLVQLREHFDAIEIIVVRHISDDGGSLMASSGAGNWYARAAAVREWLLRSDHRVRMHVEREDS